MEPQKNPNCFFILLFSISLIIGCRSDQKISTVYNDYCLSHECIYGAITRGSSSQKELALVFTGDEFADGADQISEILKKLQVYGGFFFTGKFYRNSTFESIIQRLIENGHYLGAHSDNHLLYCDWTKRDSLLITREEFIKDLNNNYQEMERFGIDKYAAPFYLPPYEWYNDTISAWTKALDLQLINFTQGTWSHADYTTPDMSNYRSSAEIYKSIIDYEEKSNSGLNGFILLSHIGTAPERTDKFYLFLEQLIIELKSRGYQFKRIDELLMEKK